MNNIVERAFFMFENYCAAIYLSGSQVDPVIDFPHDYDHICFSKPSCKFDLSMCQHLNKLRVVKEAGKINDFSSIREYPYTQITWFSYLDVLMQKEAGAELCPKTDIIIEHREEFITCLKEKVEEFLNNKIKNQKRGYHLLRGAYILINNSYEVTTEQRREINILHDLSEEGETVRDKTIKLVQTLK